MNLSADDIEWARAQARRWCKRRGIRDPNDVEDVLQTAYQALVEAAGTYDPSKGAKLTTWAYRPIHWAMKRHQRTNVRHAKKIQKLLDSAGYKYAYGSK